MSKFPEKESKQSGIESEIPRKRKGSSSEHFTKSSHSTGHGHNDSPHRADIPYGLHENFPNDESGEGQ